jgi:hypothetical protein
MFVSEKMAEGEELRANILRLRFPVPRETYKEVVHPRAIEALLQPPNSRKQLASPV